VSEQLAFDFAAVAARLADRLSRGDRWTRLTGPERLLGALVRTVDLDPDALVVAARLVLELDLEAIERNGRAAA
jgi:hypothetical protein